VWTVIGKHEHWQPGERGAPGRRFAGSGLHRQ
jgi:hypothetical protein